MPEGTIEIKNSDNHDNFVTVRDRNKAGTPIASGWNQKRLNGGASAAAVLELDGSHRAELRWTATRADDPNESRTGDESAFEGSTPVFVTSQ